jgi:parallel beta-helix repeat protein
MRSNAKSKIIILIALGILFAFSPIVTINLSFITSSCNKSSEFSDDINFDKEYLKISALSGKIHIINNSGWVDFENAGNCEGNGIYSDPYIIRDLVIDGGYSGSCILIENSNVYFIIENCTVYNSRSYPSAGIRLLNVNNSRLIDNNCSSNTRGINLKYSNNNTISGNIVNDSESRGIRLDSSDNNIISGNTANNNYWDGIYIDSSNNNTISGNTANNNNISGIDLYGSNYSTVLGNTANNNGNGIYLLSSNYNTVSGNTANNNENGIYLLSSNYNTILGNTLIGNDECIKEVDCIDNFFENNNCGMIPGYNLFFLLGTLSVAVILISKKLKKS